MVFCFQFYLFIDICWFLAIENVIQSETASYRKGCPSNRSRNRLLQRRRQHTLRMATWYFSHVCCFSPRGKSVGKKRSYLPYWCFCRLKHLYFIIHTNFLIALLPKFILVWCSCGNLLPAKIISKNQL